MSANRRLAAIMVADVVGYSRLMEADEAGTLAALKERRKAVLEPVVEGAWRADRQGDGRRRAGRVRQRGQCGARRGRTADARWRTRMTGVAEDRRIVLRIGINLGDVIGEGADIYGDGVNIAARLEALAEPGGICVSGKVHDEVRGKLECGLRGHGRAGSSRTSPGRCGSIAWREHGDAAAPRRQSAAARQAVDRGAAVRRT